MGCIICASLLISRWLPERIQNKSYIGLSKCQVRIRRKTNSTFDLGTDWLTIIIIKTLKYTGLTHIFVSFSLQCNHARYGLPSSFYKWGNRSQKTEITFQGHTNVNGRTRFETGLSDSKSRAVPTRLQNHGCLVNTTGVKVLRTKFPCIFCSCPSSQPSLAPSLHMTYKVMLFIEWELITYPHFTSTILQFQKERKEKRKGKKVVNFQMFKFDLEKAEEPVIKLPTSNGSSKKQKHSRKTSISVLLIMPKLLTVWITINCGKFWKRWKFQTTWPATWETCMQVRKQQFELDMEQQTGSKQKKEYVKPVYCHPAY